MSECVVSGGQWATDERLSLGVARRDKEFGSRMETDTGEKIMAKLGLITLLMATASVAQATAGVQLDFVVNSGSLLATAGNMPPFTGGENLSVEVRVSEPPSDASSFIRYAQLDFTNTNAALNVSNFQWDFSETASAGNGGLWAVSDNTPLPQAVFLLTSENQSVQWEIPDPTAGGSGVLLATFDVQLPVTQGSYDLNVLLGDPNNSAVGGVITTGFTSGDLLTRTLNNNGLDGGALTFTVVPEPATLVLFGLAGTVTVIRRRRRHLH